MPDARLERRELRRALIRALLVLSARQREAVLLRYGFLHGREHTLREIGIVDGMERGKAYTVENTRCLIDNALRSMRYNWRAMDALRPWRPT